MIKNYFLVLLDWCKINILMDSRKSGIVFKEGEIWWCSIGLNIGEEEFGKGDRFTRPVLVFKRFTGNSFLGLPLVGHEKTGSWYIVITIHNRVSSIVLNQARIFDKKRLRKRIITIGETDLSAIKEKFHKFYCP